MTSSMNDMIRTIKNSFPDMHMEGRYKGEIIADAAPDAVAGVLSFLKLKGFRQLSLVTCIDLIKEGKLQLVYILFDWDIGAHLILRTKLDRKKPVFNTVTQIYPGAKYYEREVHEFFGVEFIGNDDAEKPLFLESWDDMPPLRKDFDPKAYSDKKFPKREHPDSFETYISKEGER